jgi:phage terminase large subunit-like protein
MILQDRSDFLAVKAALFSKSYYAFFKYFWDTVVADPFQENFHHKLVCDELQAVAERVILRQPKEYDLIINIPPGESKSTMATVLLHPWIWSQNRTFRNSSGQYVKQHGASTRLITGGWSGSLSMRHNSLSRDCIKSDKYQALYGGDFSIRRDQDAKTYYKNDKGGTRASTSVTSSIIGEHAHLILLDDPNDPHNIDYGPQVDLVNDWHDKTISTRKVNAAITPTVVIQQRLAPNDLSGYLVNKAKEKGTRIRQISLPGEDSYPVVPAEAKKYYVGGVLNPKRKPRKVLKEMEKDLGSRGYASQIGMAPQPLAGNIVNPEWLQVVERKDVPEEVFQKVADFVVDTAYTDKSKLRNKKKIKASPSAVLKYVLFDGNGYILDYAEGYLSFGRLIKFLHAVAMNNGQAASRFYVEPKASGKSVVDTFNDPELRKLWGIPGKLNMIEYVMPKGGKEARLHGVTPFLEARRLYVLKGPWNDGYITNVTAYPNSPKSEPADLTAMACENMFKRKIYQGYDSDSF